MKRQRNPGQGCPSPASPPVAALMRVTTLNPSYAAPLSLCYVVAFSDGKPVPTFPENALQPRQRVAREVVAFLDHELEQERRARFGHAHRVLDRRHDVAGLLDPHRSDVEPLRHLGVVAADIV